MLKDLFFSTELDTHNEFFYADEWEILLPHVRRLFHSTLHGYLRRYPVLVEISNGGTQYFHIGDDDSMIGIERSPSEARYKAGVYLMEENGSGGLQRLSPFCEYAECKLHRRRELFVFAGLVPKQFDLFPLPVYFGATVTCDPVLPPWTIPALQELLAVSTHTRQTQTNRSDA